MTLYAESFDRLKKEIQELESEYGECLLIVMAKDAIEYQGLPEGFRLGYAVGIMDVLQHIRIGVPFDDLIH